MRGSELALVAKRELLLEAGPMHCGTPALLHAPAWLVSKLGVNHSGQLWRFQTGAGAAHLAAANALHLTLDPRPDHFFLTLNSPTYISNSAPAGRSTRDDQQQLAGRQQDPGAAASGAGPAAKKTGRVDETARAKAKQRLLKAVQVVQRCPATLWEACI